MREVFVDNDALDEKGILESTADLSVDLDKFEIDVFALEIGNGEYGLNGDLSKLVVRFRDTGNQSASVLYGNEFEQWRSHILLPRLVFATLTKFSVLSLVNGISSLILSSWATAISQAWS